MNEPARKPEKAFRPGDTVKTISGEVGLVFSRQVYDQVKGRIREGRRPGHFFSPGCCANPDYVLQAPVLFADGSYDVMRAFHIKKIDAPVERRKELERILSSLL